MGYAALSLAGPKLAATHFSAAMLREGLRKQFRLGLPATFFGRAERSLAQIVEEKGVGPEL